METFLINITSFPVVIFTFGLGVVIGYWCIAMLGLVDLDGLPDIEVDSSTNDLGGAVGLLNKLGLARIPITIVITLLMLNGWLICYFVSELVPGNLYYPIEILLNSIALIVSLAIALLVTAIMLRPLQKVFMRMHQTPVHLSVTGKTCRVRSTRVDQNFGEVECIHNGASLILKVRSYSEAEFKAGDQVVLIEYNDTNDTYYVVSEDKFNKELD